MRMKLLERCPLQPSEPKRRSELSPRQRRPDQLGWRAVRLQPHRLVRTPHPRRRRRLPRPLRPTPPPQPNSATYPQTRSSDHPRRIMDRPRTPPLLLGRQPQHNPRPLNRQLLLDLGRHQSLRNKRTRARLLRRRPLAPRTRRLPGPRRNHIWILRRRLPTRTRTSRDISSNANHVFIHVRGKGFWGTTKQLSPRTRMDQQLPDSRIRSKPSAGAVKQHKAALASQ